MTRVEDIGFYSSTSSFNAHLISTQVLIQEVWAGALRQYKLPDDACANCQTTLGVARVYRARTIRIHKPTSTQHYSTFGVQSGGSNCQLTVLRKGLNDRNCVRPMKYMHNS